MNKKLLALGKFLAIALAVTLLANGLINTTKAAVTQNDTSGYFSVDFNGNQQGLAPNAVPYRENVNVNTAAGFVELTPGQTTGYFHTSTIAPASFTNWTNVQLTGTYSSSNDVRVSLVDCSSSLNPIAGFQNLAPGAGGVISISGLNSGTYPCIRLKVQLTDSGGVRPTLDAIRVNWVPLPVLSTTLSADANISCGNNISYSVG